MTAPHKFTIFLASPGDTAPARAEVVEVVHAINNDAFTRDQVHIELLYWDNPDQPVPCSFLRNPQHDIVNVTGDPADCDLVIGLFRHEFGSPLPVADFGLSPDGDAWTGTEWELHRAVEAAQAGRMRDVLVFRDVSPLELPPGLNSAEQHRRFAQYQAVDAFFARCREAPSREIIKGYNEHRGLGDFREGFRKQLQEWLKVALQARINQTAAAGATSDGLPWRYPVYRTSSEDSQLSDQLASRPRVAGPLIAEKQLSREQLLASRFTENDDLVPNHEWSEPLALQTALARDRLRSAESLWKQLQADDWEGERPADLDLTSPDRFVSWLARCPAKNSSPAMWSIRRALDAMPRDDRARALAGEKAAVALYCLAACRLVDVTAAGVDQAFHTVSVPNDSHLYGAVISTALAGGKMELIPCEAGRLPRPEYSFQIKPAVDGDHAEGAFERAVFAAVCSAHPDAPKVAQGSGRLAKEELAVLGARLRTIRRVRKSSITLLVQRQVASEHVNDFSRRHKVPFLIVDPGVASLLIGIDIDNFLSDLEEFWSELKLLRDASHPHESQEDVNAKGTAPVTSPNIAINVTGGNASIALSAGNHSSAQSGTAATQQAAQDWSALLPMLQAMLAEAAKVPSPKARQKLEADIGDVIGKAQSTKPEDRSLVKSCLDRIKGVADAVEGADTIVEICAKASAFVLPFLVP